MKAESYYISPILKSELKKVKYAVTKKDRDFVVCIDGEEGSGKSVLALQIAKELDPDFKLDNVCFNADQFINRLKKSPRFTCIILDEAFSSTNSRSVLTEVNKSLIGVATEMRQRNLFVIIVIPSFFDLDKYFALWRCRALLHVYFKKEGNRGQYLIFPKTQKKYLYLMGKKFYDYSKPRSPYPACRFNNFYPVNELEYREKKAEAFRTRTVSNIARRWKIQRDALIKELYHNKEFKSSLFEKLFLSWGAKPVSQREIQRIVQNFTDRDEKDLDFQDIEANEGDNATI